MAICIALILSITRTAAADSSAPPYYIYLPAILTGNWSQTFVDSPKYFSDLGTRAVQFDSNENPCVVYGNDHLYYSCWNGAKWVDEVVDDDPGVGRFATLAFDSHDYPHIAYYDETNSMLRYAYWNGSVWKIDFVDGSLLVPSPELDSNPSQADGAPDLLQDNLQLDPSAVDGIESPGPLRGLISHKQGVGGYPSLALDKQNQAHIAYYDFSLKNLKYAVKQNGTWSKVTVDSTGDVGTYPSLAVTSSGSPIIAYYDATNGKLKLATQSGSTWTRITLDGSDSTTDNKVGLYASLVLDSADQPRIAYYNSSAHTLKYWRNGSAKTLGSNMGQYASLRLHPDGRAFITYFNEADQNLAMISLTSAGSDGEWVVDQVDSDNYVGRMGSLAISKAGLIGMVYYHSSNSELRYAEIHSIGTKIRIIDT
ncbi:MAG: hypothetical protein IH586_01385, partial [Anaerolineaceae bacterium]|nr:hypothetical protein [Anaerolineaceae bacterium]